MTQPPEYWLIMSCICCRTIDSKPYEREITATTHINDWLRLFHVSTVGIISTVCCLFPAPSSDVSKVTTIQQAALSDLYLAMYSALTDEALIHHHVQGSFLRV